MKVSICIATHNHAEFLERTLESIFAQKPPFEFEVIVIDDGSDDQTGCDALNKNRNNLSRSIVYSFGLREPGADYRNPSFARNYAMKQACGDVLICQSDDVIHRHPDTIERLVTDLNGRNEFLIATVHNAKQDDRGKWIPGQQYTGLHNPRPFFFLGSVLRKHVYAMGGNSEDFDKPGFDDNWFGDCLVYGQNLRCRFPKEIEGYHQDHCRPQAIHDAFAEMEALYKQKAKSKRFVGGAPWSYESGVSYYDVHAVTDRQNIQR